MTKTKIAEAEVTNGSGSASYTIPSDAHIGESTLYGIFQENNSYETATGTSTLYVRVPTTTSVSNVLASIGETATFTATVKHHTSQNVDEGTVQFYLGESAIGGAVNVVNGVATLQYEIPSNATTNTAITARFNQTNTYAASNDATGVLTLRADSNVTITDLSANRTDTATITAAVTDDNGDGINTGNATLYIDNVQQGQAQSVSNGSVSFQYSVANNATTGSHTIRVEYAQNNTYNAATGTGSLIVRMPTTLTAVNVSGNKGSSAPVTIQVTDENGSAVTTGTVNITVGNDSPVSAVLDNNGEATINYSIPNNASGTISFSAVYVQGTNYQAGSTTTNGVITVRLGTTVTVENITAVLGDTVTISATVDDENNDPVTSGDIEFEIEPVSS